MTDFYLPDAMMARVAKRLRAIADAIEEGNDLTDVAAQFGIPIRTLRRVAAPRPRMEPRRGKPAVSQVTLARAAKRIRDGANYREVASELGVKLTTLIRALTKRGITMRKVRDGGLSEAIELYRSGSKLSEIRERTGIPTMTLYSHLAKSELRQKHADHGTRRTVEYEGIERAVELYREGTTLREIEEQTGVPRSRVYSEAKKIGVYKPRRTRGYGPGGGLPNSQA
jgi:hypothetical protein